MTRAAHKVIPFKDQVTKENSVRFPFMSGFRPRNYSAAELECTVRGFKSPERLFEIDLNSIDKPAERTTR